MSEISRMITLIEFFPIILYGQIAVILIIKYYHESSKIFVLHSRSLIVSDLAQLDFLCLYMS